VTIDLLVRFRFAEDEKVRTDCIVVAQRCCKRGIVCSGIGKRKEMGILFALADA
jgi:hypothetical protein